MKPVDVVQTIAAYKSQYSIFCYYKYSVAWEFFALCNYRLAR